MSVWNIDLVLINEASVWGNAPDENQCRGIVQACMTALCEYDGELVEALMTPGGVSIGIRFVDDAAIRDLNRRFRGVDKSTDVLSFPLDGVDELMGEPERQLGDLFLCPQWIRENGFDGEADFESALQRCIVHGVMHLLGEDHEVGEAAAQRMLQIEEKALSIIKRSN